VPHAALGRRLETAVAAALEQYRAELAELVGRQVEAELERLVDEVVLEYLTFSPRGTTLRSASRWHPRPAARGGLATTKGDSGRRVMRRGAVVLALAVVALVTAASAASAPRVVQIKGVDAGFSFVNDFFSAACGFEVTGTVSGTANITLFLDSSGTVVREIDSFGKATTTFSGNGNSFRFPGAFGMSVQTDYPEGATLGAPAIFTVKGLLGHVSGIGADAGQDLFTATVVDFSPEGIPIVDNFDLVQSRGNRESGEDVAAAVCAELGA
jgi:hypothetical protein